MKTPCKINCSKGSVAEEHVYVVPVQRLLAFV